MNNKDKNPCPCGPDILVGETGISQAGTAATTCGTFDERGTLQMGLRLDGTLTTLRKVRLQVKEGQVHRPQVGMAWLVEGAVWRPEGLEQ